MTTFPRFSWFERYGVELEYMIVDRRTLDVRPVADRLLEQVGGPRASDVECGPMSWSNELVRHVIEVKTTEPATELPPLVEHFQRQVEQINGHLQSLDAQLMPTAMHPWMDPGQMELWPYEYGAVYRTFDRIFNCRGHGWANLQSVHLNLPFADDEQFGRLHTAIRLILPLLPALAASSPVVERQVTGKCDNRLDFYRRNSLRVPLVAGQVIPEPVLSEQQYQEQILQPMYAQIGPLDPEGILQHEWLNARGAIARFDRQSVEIRLLDLQECPEADLAICGLVVGVLRQLVDQQWSTFAEQRAIGQESLVALLSDCIDRGERAVIDDPQYLRQFGADPLARPVTTGQLWQHLRDEWSRLEPGQARPWRPAIDHLLAEGTLASRIVRALEHQSLQSVYGQLCRCLAEGRLLGQ